MDTPRSTSVKGNGCELASRLNTGMEEEMHTHALYSTSQHLMDIVCGVAAQVSRELAAPLGLVETITLPDFGQRVILRFAAASEQPLAPTEADALETRLRAMVGRDFWAALTSGPAHLDGEALALRLIDIDRAMPASALQFPSTQHSESIRQDADTVRRSLGLGDECLIWEIEMPLGDDHTLPLIRIVDRQEEGHGVCTNRTPGSALFGGKPHATVFLKHNTSFRGCVKAYLAAEQRGVALNSFIAQFKSA